MTTTSAAPACTQPGCTGTIEDGYCNWCGSPATPSPGPATSGTGTGTGGTTPDSAPRTFASPSAALGTGLPADDRDQTVRAAVSGAAASLPSGVVGPGTGSTRTSSSSRIASAALGSARSRATGSRATRRIGTGSKRMREHRLGAGITTVPPTPVVDPVHAVMSVPEVPEHKRYCPSCGNTVGRAREGVPGRTQGFCPRCGTRFDFDPQLGPGDLVGGQYEVVGCLAHGGLGWIYLARDQNVSGRWVVLKGLLNAGDADAYAAAISERQFLAEVEHPLIVEIYNFAMHDGAGYTVMEYVGGTSLKGILSDRRAANDDHNDPLPPDQALAYVLEVLPAFGYLHDKGLLFCDFKPDNIIQQGDGVKLIDLGGVRRVEDMESAIYGTVGYQAPEVADVGPSVASDVYTIGRTLATLVLDFRGNTTTYVASLPPVVDTPVFQQYDSFYRLLTKACAFDPSDRFGTIDEMRAQTLGVLREVAATNRTDTRTAPNSAASVLFHTPVADVPGRPLRWDELPALRVDDDDPGAGWLAGVNVTDPADRIEALAAAPVESAEVLLERARTGIEAGRLDIARGAVAQILADDPWEWRAAWIGGLIELAAGDPVAASASFNAVYGQVPGELAPKLALATACESSGEADVAEALYAVCARTDANYTAPSAFGLARIRRARGDLDGALTALDDVGSTRGSFVDARLLRGQMLAASGRGLPALADALRSIDGVSLPARDRSLLAVSVLGPALDTVLASGPSPATTIGGVPADEPSLRDALERSYRELASLTEDHEERIAVVDRANAVRRWTLR